MPQSSRIKNSTFCEAEFHRDFLAVRPGAQKQAYQSRVPSTTETQPLAIQDEPMDVPHTETIPDDEEASDSDAGTGFQSKYFWIPA